MKWFSDLISALLVSLIVLTAQSAAAARMMPDAAGQMVICTSTGPMMVYVDAHGEPTGAPRICPEFALSLIVAVAFESAVVDARGAWVALEAAQVPFAQAALQLGTPNARGPPVLV